MVLHSREQLLHLVPQLAAFPAETEWVEFKQNNSDPEMIGKNLSGLANSARITGESFGYLIWGVEDDEHAIVGTTFEPEKAKQGNQELESWLVTLLSPCPHFEFTSLVIGRIRVVVLSVEASSFEPVKFQGKAYVRIGATTRELSWYVDHERRLWRALDRESFEFSAALERETDDDVLRLLDYPAYFDLLELPLPDNRVGILGALERATR